MVMEAIERLQTGGIDRLVNLCNIKWQVVDLVLISGLL